MRTTTLFASAVWLSSTAWAQWTLEDDYFSGNFFDSFSFFTSSDPTHGFVQYQDRGTASNNGLISGGTNGNSVYMGVDSSNNQPNGRPSVRITSNKSYNSGTLVIMDASHMPGGICGTWPAFWMVGPNWPTTGEIDIIEGVNSQNHNDMTLHTSSGCTIGNNGQFSGTITTSDCSSSPSNNDGCQIASYGTNTFGAGFNSIGGGVYATEFVNSAITVWFFQRGSIPSDITNGSPNPSGWGEPLAQFVPTCSIPNHFQNLQIVYDTTFCGDWAGAVWGSDSTCSGLADSCNDYVANNPGAFANAYWTVNSLRTYSGSATQKRSYNGTVY